MKITIEKQTTTTEETEINLPYFVSYGGNFIKILSETEYISVDGRGQITNTLENYQVMFCRGYKPTILLYINGGTPITEEQFNAALKMNNEKIQAAITSATANDHKENTLENYPLFELRGTEDDINEYPPYNPHKIFN